MAAGWAPRGQDPEKMKAMLEVYRAEADVLKERLADGHREVASLRSRLRDAEGELLVAHQATNTATERLGLHAQRHGLVLAAGVERIGAERATLEDELQRMEQVLSERDQDIARLRKEARALEAKHFHSEMELQGLQAARAAAGGPSAYQMSDPRSSRPHGAVQPPGRRGGALLPRGRPLRGRQGQPRCEAGGPGGAPAARGGGGRGGAAPGGGEEAAIAARVAEAERSLREKHAAMEAQDKDRGGFLKEQELLREHNEKLRQALQLEQHDSVSIDQRAVLHQQCGTEAEGVRNEVQNILATMPQLAETLAARGKYVHSAEVPDDPVDVAMHAYLRGLGPAGTRPPAVVCRLGPGDYVVDKERMAVSVEQGQLLMRSASSSGAVAVSGAVAASEPAQATPAATVTVAAEPAKAAPPAAVRPMRQRSSIC
ncbi:unnamed protein product [Prorocentrum cordatum]|uniref:Uncharacterized protein n=1 Tax=Prorocentrum cordatum TaxID=2364126 RepID=A0ABN9XHJ7_9DINO|nr:unnamed protein product [Polarella glacialis]